MLSKTSWHPPIPETFQIVVDICRFERGPQDMTNSLGVTAAAAFCYAVVRTVVAIFTVPSGIAVLSASIDTVLLTLIVVGALFTHCLLHRAIQTLGSFFATGTVVGLVTIVCYTATNLGPEQLLVLGVGHALTFPLVIWNLAINTSILRHALSTSVIKAFGLAFLYFFSLWLITEALLRTVTR